MKMRQRFRGVLERSMKSDVVSCPVRLRCLCEEFAPSSMDDTLYPVDINGNGFELPVAFILPHEKALHLPLTNASISYFLRRLWMDTPTRDRVLHLLSPPISIPRQPLSQRHKQAAVYKGDQPVCQLNAPHPSVHNAGPQPFVYGPMLSCN